MHGNQFRSKIGSLAMTTIVRIAMATKWAETEVKRWLQGQKVAMEKVEEERFHFLLQLTPEESLRIYLSLQQGNTGDGWSVPEPSPILWAMRRTLERYVQGKRKRL